MKQILEASVKSDSCWNGAVDMLKKSNFFSDHKADIEVIFKGYSTDGLISVLADVILSDTNGKEYSLISLIKKQNGNKKTLVDLWATWRVPCLEKNKALQVVMFHIKEDVAVIKISVYRKEQMTEWTELAKSEKDSYIAKSGLQAFSKRFGTQSIPRYILFDKEGGIVDENFIRPSDVNFVKRIKDNN